MKTSIKYITLFVLSLFAAGTAFPQTRQTDLLVSINQPSDNTIVQWGDTADFSFFIQNLGPDSLLVNDTVGVGFLYFGQVFPLYGVTLAPGDTIQFNNAASIWNDDKTVNDTGKFCMSVSIVSGETMDNNTANDTTCVSYVLLGDTTTGIAATQANKPLKLFPNPASGLVNIQLNTEGYRQLQLRVTDVFGREILFHDYATKNSFGKSDIQFDATGFSPGVYFVRLRADDKTFMSKLVVR